MKQKSGETKRESTGEKVDNSKKLCGQFSAYLHRGIGPAFYVLPRGSMVSASYGAGCRISRSSDFSDVHFLPGKTRHIVAFDRKVFFAVEPHGFLTASTRLALDKVVVMVFPALKRNKK